MSKESFLPRCTYSETHHLARANCPCPGATGDYLYLAGTDVFIDGEDPFFANWCRFINHEHHQSSACNLDSKSLPVSLKGKPRVWFVANRDISEGEELNFDYGEVSCVLSMHPARGHAVRLFLITLPLPAGRGIAQDYWFPGEGLAVGVE